MTRACDRSRRPARADLLARSALCGVLAGLLGARQAIALPAPAAPTTQVSGGGASPTISTAGSTMTVATGATRTVINWNTYVINSGETVNYTFVNRSDIALNVLPADAQVQINGALNAYVGTTSGPYGGNVWFSAPGGIIFGSTAVVNVGGLLATTGVIDSANFVNATTSFPFTAYPGPATTSYPGIATSNTSGGAGVTVAGIDGSSNFPQINAHGGLIALVAPFVNVGAGAQIKSTDETANAGYGGAGSVLYGAADGFTLTLAQETSGDLDMLQFIIQDPSQVTDYPIIHQGQTQGTNVYVTSLSAAGVSGAVVNLAGMITATKASAGPGGEILLTSGSDTIDAPAYTPASSGFPAVYTPGSATISPGSSYPSVTIDLPQTVSVGGGIDASPGRDVQISSGGSIAGDLTAVEAGTDVSENAGANIGANTIIAGGGVDLTAVGGIIVHSTLQANGGDASFTAGASLTLAGATSASGDLTAISTTVTGGTTFGTGVINVVNANVGGGIDLEGTDAYATSLTAGAGVTATSYYAGGSRGRAVVDIGSIDVTGGDATLTANDGYASLTNMTFGGSGQTLQISAFDPAGINSVNHAGNVYLGYAQDSGSGPGQSGGSGGVANSGAVNLSADDDVLIDVSGPLTTLGSINAGRSLTAVAAGDLDLTGASLTVTGDVSLTGSNVELGAAPTASGYPGALTIRATGGNVTDGSALEAVGTIDIAATGHVALGDVTSTSGSVTLKGASGVSFGAGAADADFVATSITGTPGAGTAASPSTGTGDVSGGDVTTTGGYIDLEGVNVTAGTLTAGGSNPSNGYSIYAAAWGTTPGAPGTLNLVSPDPSGPYNTTTDFLYPTPTPTPTPAPTPTPTPTPAPTPTPTPTPTVSLPQLDASSTPRVEAGGALPTIVPPAGGAVEAIGLNARRTVIDWTSFQIGKGGEVDFVFNPASGQSAANARGNIVLNRITGGGPVDIEGVLASTVRGDSQAYGGNVWFSAPGGVIFGAGSVVNLGGLLATTAAFSPANLSGQFLDPNNFTFQLSGGASGVDLAGGAQINASGGLVALLGSYLDVQPGASIGDAGANGTGAAAVLYAEAPAFSLVASQPASGGDLGFGSLALVASDLSGSATPLDLEGATSAANVYAAALSPASTSGAKAKLSGPIVASGEVILSTAADSLTAGARPTATSAAVGPIDMSLGQVQAGGDLQILGGGAVEAPNLSAGGALLVSSSGSVSLGTAAAGASARIVAASLDLATSLSAPSVAIESANGPFAVGGSAAPAGGGLWLSDATFARIQASGTLSLYAGPTTGTQRGDFTVNDLTIDPAKTPTVAIYAAPARTVSVVGTVAPTTSGGELDIGGPDPAWIPGQILISGALGSSTRLSDTEFADVRGFSQIKLDAGDVLIGSSRFIALVQATPADSINLAANHPAGVAATGSEIGKVFITAGQLAVTATGKLVQQNTSGSATAFSGLYLTGAPGSAGADLTIDPPTVVDLSGSYVLPSGALISGQQTSFGSAIVVEGLGGDTSLLARYHFNGCQVGVTTTCGLPVGSEQGLQPGQQFQSDFLSQAAGQDDIQPAGQTDSQTGGPSDSEAAGQSSSSALPSRSIDAVLLPIAPPAQADAQSDLVVTGAGNEEIWRRHPGGPK